MRPLTGEAVRVLSPDSFKILDVWKQVGAGKLSREEASVEAVRAVLPDILEEFETKGEV